MTDPGIDQPVPLTGPYPLPARPAGRKLRWRRFAYAFVFCFLLSAFCFFCRAPLLSATANVWIVGDPIEKADAVVILGGGLETRPFEAARLFQQGIVPRILGLDADLNAAEKLGVTKSTTELTREVLTKLEVPDSAVILIGNKVTSTREESLAVAQWVREHKPSRIIVPTEIFHTRRVRWIFRKLLKSENAAVCVDVINPPKYTAANWWQHEEGLIAFQNEFLKYILYRFKY